jgi:hypothetical protein
MDTDFPRPVKWLAAMFNAELKLTDFRRTLLPNCDSFVSYQD